MTRLGADPDIVDAMIRKAPVVLKESLNLKASRKYANAVSKAGGRVEIQEYAKKPKKQGILIVPFKDFTMCPECGLKQQKKETCVRCGFRLVKIENGLEPKNAAGH